MVCCCQFALFHLSSALPVVVACGDEITSDSEAVCSLQIWNPSPECQNFGRVSWRVARAVARAKLRTLEAIAEKESDLKQLLKHTELFEDPGGRGSRAGSSLRLARSWLASC